MLAVAVIAVAAYNVTLSSKYAHITQVTLTNIMTLAKTESLTVAECISWYPSQTDAVWEPDSSMKSRLCWNLGTHQVCKDKAGSCCNTSKQTDCKGLLDSGLITTIIELF
jgi:hypothetical protein